MSKLLTAIILSGILITGLVSCSDDGSTDLQFGPEQHPLENLIRRLTEKETTLLSTFTFGSMLEFQKAGRISALCMRAKTDGTFHLTLWDLSDSSIITSSQVTVDARDLECIDISDVMVAEDDRVAVTMTGNAALFWDNNGPNIYPSSLGDVNILGFGIRENSIGVQFPNDFHNDIYMGLSDIVFEPKLD